MVSKNYSTGYKKPPKSGQFKSGQSGNPRGRPRGTKNLATDLQEELSSKIIVREGNQERTVSKQRALIKSLSSKALSGDIRAINTLVRMIERTLPDEPPEIDTTPISSEDEALLQAFFDRCGRS
jgi:hypothetical protein